MSQGSSCARRSSLRIEVENSMRKRKDAKKKQWQDILRGISHLAAALYWFVKLIREILS